MLDKSAQYTNTDDEKLFSFIEKGDKGAFTQAYDRYHKLLYVLAYRYLMNADPTVIDKLEINFRRDERVIRFLTFKMDKYAAEYAAKRRSVKSNKKED